MEPERSNVRPRITHSPKGLYFGWWIVGISAVFHGVMGGLYQTGLSVYFLPLTRDFGISYTKLSLAFSLRALEGGIEGPVAGFLSDRFGPKMIVLAGVLMGGFGFILLATTNSYAMFLLVFLTLLTIGFSVPYHSLAMAINLWFRRRLGLAMSLASSGGGVGGFLLTPIIAWVVLFQGWRWAATYSGILMLAIGLPLAFIVRRPSEGEASREDSPWPPNKATQDTCQPPSDRAMAAARPYVDFTIGETLRTNTYWLVALAIGLRLVGQSALMVHMVPILVSKGIDEGAAATLVAVMSLMRLPSMVGIGFLADLWSRPKASALTMFAGFLAAMSVVWGPSGFITGVTFAMLFAMAQSGNSITWALVGHYFGRRNFGTLRGGATLIGSLMSTSGPIITGWIFDRMGSYSAALVGIGITYAISGIVFWVLKTPVKPTLRMESS